MLSCLSIIDRKLSVKYNIVPIEEKKDSILCIASRFNKGEVDNLEILLNKRVVIEEVSIEELNEKRIEVFKSYERIKILEKIELLNQYKLNIHLENSIENKSPIIEIMDLIIEHAIVEKCSDIHIEGIEREVVVKIRIDGSLKELCRLNKEYQQKIISRIKVLSNLDYTVKNIPQDSRFTYKYNNKNIDIRVATTPTVYGEKIVLRILDKNNVDYTKEGIGLYGEDVIKVNKLLSQPSGLILSVGPTGCGKSSTIYTFLKYLMNEEINIITIEDPVEYKIEGINQININEEAGLDFNEGLKAILRLDPDVLMLGEIRSLDTATTAIRASITGRKVFSTIHTSDSPSTIYRLLDMGVENYLISSGVIGIISQRLVRKLCDCKRKKKDYIELYDEVIEYYEPVGCEKCNDGYIGRVAIFEILILNQKLKEGINKNKSLDELREIAKEGGMVTLKEAMKKAVLEGKTSIDEVYKNIMTIGD